MTTVNTGVFIFEHSFSVCGVAWCDEGDGSNRPLRLAVCTLTQTFEVSWVRALVS